MVIKSEGVYRMNINLKPLYYDGLNCVENSFISITAWLKLNYQLAFMQSWDFGFKTGEAHKNDLFSSRITLNPIDYRMLIDKYCAIQFTYNTITDPNETLKIITNEFNNGRPVIIFIESFWCPWKDEYQKAHTDHFCLALGINDNGDIHCVDCSPLNYGCVLPLNEFLRGGGDCITFIVSDDIPKAMEFEKVIGELVKDLYKPIDGYNTFDSIRNFAFDFKNSFDLMKEIEGNDLSSTWGIPIIQKLRSVSGGRAQYADFLRCFYSKRNIDGLLELCAELEYVSAKWKYVMSIIEKHILSKKPVNVDKISNIVFEIADLEEAIAQKIKTIKEKSSLNAREDNS